MRPIFSPSSDPISRQIRQLGVQDLLDLQYRPIYIYWQNIHLINDIYMNLFSTIMPISSSASGLVQSPFSSVFIVCLFNILPSIINISEVYTDKFQTGSTTQFPEVHVVTSCHHCFSSSQWCNCHFRLAIKWFCCVPCVHYICLVFWSLAHQGEDM